MGRPYADELATLGDTFGYALAADIADLTQAIDELRSRPLIVIGSGGSVSACQVAARLHESAARLPARVMTPLEFMRLPLQQSAGVLLLSASGRNPDILTAASHAARAEYGSIAGLSTRPRTALRERLRSFRHAKVFEYVGPSKKDGFLATNSLLLTSTLLARSYGLALPSSLPALARGAKSPTLKLCGTLGKNDVQGRLLEGLARPHIVVLADGWSTPAAVDLESKWGELGLGAVTVTDARNFAHGRHHGLSRRLADTLVLGLSTPETSRALDQTLKRLPPQAAVASLQTSLEGAAGALDLLAQVIRLTGAVAAKSGIDPGRPRVPAFGRALYRAKMPQQPLGESLASDGVLVTQTSARDEAGHRQDLWIQRKVSPAVWSGASSEIRDGWRARRDAWIATVGSLRVGAVVLDYDGTLCEADERSTVPAVQVGHVLTRLIDDGMVIGVATGRGGSVLTALRAIIPKRLWSRIIVGMYNGGILHRLDDRTDATRDIAPSIRQAHDLIACSTSITSIAVCREQPTQLTVYARRAMPEGLLLRFVREALGATGNPPDVTVVGSCHTVDVIPSGVSKLRVVDAVVEELAAVNSASGLGDGFGRTAPIATSNGIQVMTVGDQGYADGNDFTFLAHPLGLSVENASSNLTSCWNVAPPGTRRTMALLAYLNALHANEAGGFTWSVASASAGVRVAPTKPKQHHTATSTAGGTGRGERARRAFRVAKKKEQ